MSPLPDGAWVSPALTRPWRCDVAVLDVDGVLVDVEASFREGVRVTVARVLGELGCTVWTPRVEDVRRLKRAGGFNDDIDTAIALTAVAAGGRTAELDAVAGDVERAGGGLGGLRLAAPDLPRIPGRLVLRVFNEHYWGLDGFRLRFGTEPEHDPPAGGLRAGETALVPPDFPALLREAGVVHVAVVSGRTPMELDAALELLRWNRGELTAVVTGDQVRKPDPAALDLVVAATAGRNLLYAGDVRDDWELVHRYREERDGTVHAVGVIVGDEAAALRELGCDATLPAATALPALIARLRDER